MNVARHKRFTKAFNKRIKPYVSLVEQFKQRWSQFEENPKNSLLKDHQLKHNLKGFRAFSITGDMRLVYKKSDILIISLR